MNGETSRRNFLLSGLAIPVALNSNASFLPQAEKTKATAALTYRPLGKTGLKPTSVGFGCMNVSDKSVVERAADLGINYFDTARVYQQGNNERMVGAALKPKRKNLIIATKTMSQTKEEALQHIDTSLKELGMDYVDIWHLHMKDKPADLKDELLEAQQIAKKAGKVRFLGVSTHQLPAIVDAVIQKAAHFDVILTQYNFSMDAAAMDAAIGSAAKAGLGIIAMKTMMGGPRMAGRGAQGAALKKEGAMLAALKWVLKNPNVHTTIPGITDMDQIDEDMRAFAESFTDSDQKILTAHLREIRPLYCSMCYKCEGKCPKGLPVADVLRYLAYAEGYGEFQLGRQNFLSLPAETRNVRCTSCTECTIKCPNGVRVAQRLAVAQELFA